MQRRECLGLLPACSAVLPPPSHRPPPTRIQVAAVAALRAENAACATARARAEGWKAQLMSAAVHLTGVQEQLQSAASKQQQRYQGLLRLGGKPGGRSAGAVAAAAGGGGVAPNVRKAFELFDADGSGDIDAAELEQAS